MREQVKEDKDMKEELPECETAADEHPETAAGGAHGAKENAGEKEAGADAAEKDRADGKEPGESVSGKKEESQKKGFFSKKKDKKDEQIEELTDRIRRTMAEFDNFRKRTEKEKSAMYEIGARDMVEKILPVVDNFERGLSAPPADESAKAFVNGMEMIYKQLLKALDEAGVKAIDAVGQPFDPNFHNAVMHVEDDSVGENTVVEEFQKGYLYRNAVVRHSMVKVAN